MKKLLSLVFVVAMMAAAGSSYAEYVCQVSADPEKNVGFCLELSTGNGDMCFTSGDGPACYKTLGVKEGLILN